MNEIISALKAALPLRLRVRLYLDGCDRAIARRFHGDLGAQVQLDRLSKHAIEQIIHMSHFLARDWLRAFDDHKSGRETESILDGDVNEVRSGKSLQLLFDELPRFGAQRRLSEGPLEDVE